MARSVVSSYGSGFNLPKVGDRPAHVSSLSHHDERADEFVLVARKREHCGAFETQLQCMASACSFAESAIASMKFRSKTLRALAEMVVGDARHFPYRSSSYITEFFDDCGLNFVHDGSTRWCWTSERLAELLAEPQPGPHALPDRFVHVLRVLMDPADAEPDDPDRALALDSLNKALVREGYEAFYADGGPLYVRHVGTQILSSPADPHRPLTARELERRDALLKYLEQISEDELIAEVLLPLFRQLGFREDQIYRISQNPIGEVSRPATLAQNGTGLAFLLEYDIEAHVYYLRPPDFNNLAELPVAIPVLFEFSSVRNTINS